MTMSLCIAFMSHLRSMNSTASQSSSSGCVGGSPCVPKSSLVSTRPLPKCCAQMRFIVTRAVSGLFGSTSQFARPRRLAGAPAGSGCSLAGTPGLTSSPRFLKLPRIMTCVGRGCGSSFITSVVAGLTSAASFSSAAAAQDRGVDAGAAERRGAARRLLAAPRRRPAAS